MKLKNYFKNIYNLIIKKIKKYDHDLGYNSITK